MKPMHFLIASATLGAAAAAVATAGAPAAAPRSDGRDCFNASSVSGFRPVDRETVDFTVGVRRHYRLELLGYCPDVDWSWRIALRTRSGSSWICRGLDAELIVPSPTGTQRCPVGSVRRLTEEEYRASGRRR